MASSTEIPQRKPKPVLVLDTLAPDRATVLIKTPEDRRGHHYEIATLDDLSIQDSAEISRLNATLTELAPKVDAALAGEGDQNADSSDLALFDQTIDRFLKVVIRDISQDVLDRLRLMQKEQLLDAFTEASPELARTIRAATEEAAIPARRSRGSNDSTVARPKRGSTSNPRS